MITASALLASTLIDGVAATTVSVDERALHYGDGLFETMSCRAGRVRWFD